jgi:hypothetical protein
MKNYDFKIGLIRSHKRLEGNALTLSNLFGKDFHSALQAQKAYISSCEVMRKAGYFYLIECYSEQGTRILKKYIYRKNRVKNFKVVMKGFLKKEGLSIYTNIGMTLEKF